VAYRGTSGLNSICAKNNNTPNQRQTHSYERETDNQTSRYILLRLEMVDEALLEKLWHAKGRCQLASVCGEINIVAKEVRIRPNERQLVTMLLVTFEY
jgi:hypothetical protein